MPIKEDKLSAMEAHVRGMDEYLKSTPIAVQYRPACDFWQASVPTYIEQWPDSLHRLSVPSTQIRLTLDEARVLGSYIIELGEAFEEVPQNREAIRQQIIRRLDMNIRSYPHGAFVRLGSRSPKDSFYWGMDPDAHAPNGQITTGVQAFELLTCCSERVYEDLQTQLSMKYESSIWLRQGNHIDDWSEFRCFMQDRKLIGMSQYMYRAAYPEIPEDAGALKWAIEQFFETQFRDASHLDNVVFDVFVKVNKIQSVVHRRYEVKLLEINPFFRLTDPCLFNWNKPEEFAGQLRYIDGLGERSKAPAEI